MAGFCDALGLRLAERHPERIAGLIVQNANAHEEGLSGMAREAVAQKPGVPGAEEKVRALLLWGRHDPIFIETGAHAWRRDLPEARLRLFDGGHFMLEEYAAEVAALVDEFLAGLSFA